jgi:hypothetical protein
MERKLMKATTSRTLSNSLLKTSPKVAEESDANAVNAVAVMVANANVWVTTYNK